MKFKILILLILNNYLCFSQTLYDSDSLKKYSYYIVGVSDSKDTMDKNSKHVYQGTGVFIAHDTDTYFITARHVLTGLSHKCVRNENYPDYMTIKLMGEDGEFNKNELRISLIKIKDTSKCPSFTEPDLIKYKIKNPKKYPIYCINKFIPIKLPLKKEAREISIFGFLINKNYAGTSFKLVSATQMSFTPIYEFYNNFATDVLEHFGEVDYTHYKLIANEMPSVESSPGISGSPVFIKNTFTQEWIFLGLISQVTIRDNAVAAILIAKSSFIENSFK